MCLDDARIEDHHLHIHVITQLNMNANLRIEGSDLSCWSSCQSNLFPVRRLCIECYDREYVAQGRT